MKRATNNHNHLDFPPEIIEEILLNLPFKSLTRFSSVSKSWNSMISRPHFIKRYQARECPNEDFLFLCAEIPTEDSTCPLSSISWDNIPAASAFASAASPFEKKHPQLWAMCDELLLGYGDKSLLLWNPTTTRCKKLPEPLFMSWPRHVYMFTFGLGYDSVGDDFKILKIPPAYDTVCAEVYSLRCDSWREIQHFPADIKRGTKGVFVTGKLHWLRNINDDVNSIIWFDLSSEKFGEVAGPDYIPLSNYKKEMSALRGMLCMSFNYYEVEDDDAVVCAVWVMDEAESWSHKFSVKCGVDVSEGLFKEWIAPLYVYDNGEILVRVNIGEESYRICVYKDEDSGPKEVINRRCGIIHGGFLYARLQLSRSSSLLRF